MAFAIGPLLAPCGGSGCTPQGVCDCPLAQVSSAMRLMYANAVLSLLVFLAILARFPAAPPLPPSVSAAKSGASGARVEYGAALKALACHGPSAAGRKAEPRPSACALAARAL